MWRSSSMGGGMSGRRTPPPSCSCGGSISVCRGKWQRRCLSRALSYGSGALCVFDSETRCAPTGSRSKRSKCITFGQRSWCSARSASAWENWCIRRGGAMGSTAFGCATCVLFLPSKIRNIYWVRMRSATPSAKIIYLARESFCRIRRRGK